MRPLALAAAILSLCAPFVRAQTETVVDALGQTVVEVITVDPQLGLPTTQTLQTLSSTSTSTTTTVAAGQVGPVGQPQATTDGTGPTVYTYTTTDANGDTVALVATFTPSFAPTAGGSITAGPGTILDYSSWRASIGTHTVGQLSSASWALSARWAGIGATLFASVAGGALLALA